MNLVLLKADDKFWQPSNCHWAPLQAVGFYLTYQFINPKWFYLWLRYLGYFEFASW